MLLFRRCMRLDLICDCAIERGLEVWARKRGIYYCINFRVNLETKWIMYRAELCYAEMSEVRVLWAKQVKCAEVWLINVPSYNVFS